MIKIEYTNEIKINTGDLSKVFKPEQLPLRFQITKVISKTIIWEVDLSSNMWAVFPDSEMKDVVVKDVKGNFVYQYHWDVLQHGSIFYNSLWLYCKSLINSGRKPKGLAIGTHDGEFGEWVPLVKNFMSDIVLVEASEKQFNQLRTNFSEKQGLEFINELITTDGKDVEFFEGGLGYTNSIVERVIRNWEIEQINSTIRKSISINDLIAKYNHKFDWIHLDVEGLDAKLLMSVKEEYLPKFIIFEDNNLINEEKDLIYRYFKDRFYNLHSELGICMVNKT